MHPDNLDELDVPEDWRQWNDERRGFNLTLAVKKEPSPSPRPGRSKTRPREVRSQTRREEEGGRSRSRREESRTGTSPQPISWRTSFKACVAQAAQFEETP